MAQSVDPKDIPPMGRYDFTVKQAGDIKYGGQKVPGIAAVIDNGRFKGKRIVFPSPDTFAVGQRFSATVVPKASALIDGQWVSVPLDYRDSNPRIRYVVTDVKPPQAGTDFAVKDPRDKFKRTFK